MRTIDFTELRASVRAFLLTKHQRVYHKRAPESAQMPYVVFDLPNSYQNGLQEVFVLEVDGWDIADDPAPLESLMGNLDGDGDIEHPTGLNRATLRAGEMVVRVYRTARLSIVDNEEQIKRRKYSYKAIAY